MLFRFFYLKYYFHIFLCRQPERVKESCRSESRSSVKCDFSNTSLSRDCRSKNDSSSLPKKTIEKYINDVSDSESHFCKVPKARELLYQQYFRGMGSTSAAYNALSRKNVEKKGKSRKHPSKGFAKSTEDKKTKKLNRRKQKVDKKIKTLKKKFDSLSKKLLDLEEQNDVTRKKMEASKKRIQILELQDHDLNLEYADLENRENCMIFPL